jgi:hypothetical protein
LIKNIFSLKGMAFIFLFTILSLLASNINFSKIIGSENQTFTFFQFIGPISGGFLGAGAGILSVMLAQIISFIWLGKQLELINILRFLPMVFAAFYFAKYQKGKIEGALVGLICMALFIIHPIGSQVWYYSLYWLIPLLAVIIKDNLLLRSFGSTFTAHAVGSTIWLYFVPSTPEMWVLLIPIVAYERTIFALGISLTYYAFNTVFSKIDAIAKSEAIVIDKRYALFKKDA